MSTSPDRPCLIAGIDFSGGSSVALEWARVFADRMGTALRLVHVFSPSEAFQFDGAAERWLAAEGLTPDSIQLRYGKPWVELARAATAADALALVVGTHGRSGSQPVALGSTAARLGLAAPCPVIVVNSLGRQSFLTGAGLDPIEGVRPSPGAE